MEEKVKKDFVEGLTNYAYELIRGDLASKYVCYEEFLVSLEDAFYYGYLEYSKEREEEGEDFEKLWNEVKEEVLENVKNIAIKEIEDELRDYKSIALFLGVQHVNTPYKYYPAYKLLSEEEIKDNKDAFEKLSEFVEPHAWGVFAYYDNWGNYWAIVINEENYKELIEDMDIAFAVLKRDYVEFTLTKNNTNNLRP
jgi:hypothetical protein